MRYADQGSAWTDDKRTLYYDIDQGSQLIPLAWLEALKQADGKPFLDGSLSRYGFLPQADPAHAHELPIGFTRMPSGQGAMVGVSCAACHVRDLTVGKVTWRIDGGPSNNDFAPFVTDLDTAVTRVHDDPAVFQAFATAVLGPAVADSGRVAILRAEFGLWWVRFHTFIAKSLPKDRLWGPSRMDAISLIYNRLAGLDVGPPPTYLLPQNIEVGHAPVRYPFLWNAWHQAITQWTGFAANGNTFYGLTRNLGEEYGVFGTLHPQATTATFTILNRNYLVDNSANLKGLVVAEDLTKSMGPPKWPWPVDSALAERGKALFDRPVADGGCVVCHGIVKATSPQGVADTWKTPVIDVGTDRQAWHVILRRFQTGSMRGASLQGLVPPMGETDTVINLVRAAVVGAIADDAKARPQVEAQAEATPDPQARLRRLSIDKIGLAALKLKAAFMQKIGYGPPGAPPLVVNGYEARVLEGIWAAAPYLHNGSVPSLTELLKPAGERIKSFKLGPEYDPATVGVAANQPQTGFTLHTTGCDDLLSGRFELRPRIRHQAAGRGQARAAGISEDAVRRRLRPNGVRSHLETQPPPLAGAPYIRSIPAARSSHRELGRPLRLAKGSSMLTLAIILAFFGAEPGIPPVPSVAPPPRAQAPAPGYYSRDRGRFAAPLSRCRSSFGRGRYGRCRRAW